MVLLFTLVLTGFGIYGNVLLRQEFDPTWFLPEDTYISQWFVNNKKYFPSSGERGTVYFSGAKLPEDILRIDALVENLKAETESIAGVNSWTGPYLDYIGKLGFDGAASLNKTSFQSSFTQFLFSPVGAAFRQGFRFTEELRCGEPAPEVLLSEITYTHR